MFIGDHGKVIELKHIKWLIVGTMILLAAAIVAAVILFVFNQKLTYANKKLRQSLETSQASMNKVRQQTDLLMAQLALAEAKIKDASPLTILPEVDDVEPAAKTQSVDSPPPQPASPQKTAVQNSPESRQKLKAAPKPKSPKPAPTPVTVEPSADLVMVEIDDLQLTRPKGSGNLSLEFKIRNVSPNPHRIEGRVIAILKGDDLLPNEWLTIPKVTLKDGRPTEKKGHRFAINNWRTMRMKTGYTGPLESYNLVEIFVYSSDGEVLLREVHPVTPQ